MILTLLWQETNSHGQSYIRTTTITYKSKQHLYQILDDAENNGKEREEFKIDDSKMPKGYGFAGGFDSRLISAEDENRKDCRLMFKDWYL